MIETRNAIGRIVRNCAIAGIFAGLMVQAGLGQVLIVSGPPGVSPAGRNSRPRRNSSKRPSRVERRTAASTGLQALSFSINVPDLRADVARRKSFTAEER